MSDNIKIVFNWIGPRGPIPNTEVPNLLNTASVLEDIQTNTSRFWADNIWPLIFCNQDNYTISPSTYLDHDDKFVYPFQAVKFGLNDNF